MAAIPFLLPLLGLLAGIASAMLGAGLISGFLIIGIGLAMSFFITKRGKKATDAYRLRRFHAIWIFLLVAGTGIIATDIRRPESFDEKFLSECVAVGGEILDKSTTSYGDRVLLGVDRIILADGTLVKEANCKAIVNCGITSAETGDIAVFPATLKPVGENANRRDNGYADYLRRKGIYLTAWSDGKGIVTEGRAFTLHSVSRSMRDAIVEKIELSGLERGTVNFLVTVLTGDREFMSDSTRDLFSEAGVSHALALSGMHIGIIIAILMALFFPLSIAGRYKIRLLLTLGAVWIFTIITGMSPSAMRASIMATFFFTAVLLERKNNIFNSLCGAAFIILLFDPYSLFDVGLQMSFTCVALIAAFAGPLNPMTRHIHPRSHAVMSFLLTTLVVSAGIWAVTSYYFKSVPLLFLPANILLLPLLPLYLSAAILYVLLSVIGVKAGFLAEMLDYLYEKFVDSLEFISGEGSSVLHIEVDGITVVLWLITVFFLALYVNGKRMGKFHLAVPAATFVIALVLIVSRPVEAEADEMIFQKRHDSVSMLVYEGDKERLLQPPANCITVYDIAGKKVVAVDAPVPDTLTMQCDYLIVTRGFKGAPEILARCFRPGMIITHPSMFRKRERSIIEAANEVSVSVHSLRESGPLWVNLDPVAKKRTSE